MPLTPLVLDVLREHQQTMKQLGIYDLYGLVFVAPTSYSNVYDHLLGRVWHRSLQRCGLKLRRLYAQRHSFLSHALVLGNSPADSGITSWLTIDRLPLVWLYMVELALLRCSLSPFILIFIMFIPKMERMG